MRGRCISRAAFCRSLTSRVGHVAAQLLSLSVTDGSRAGVAFGGGETLALVL